MPTRRWNFCEVRSATEPDVTFYNADSSQVMLDPVLPRLDLRQAHSGTAPTCGAPTKSLTPSHSGLCERRRSGFQSRRRSGDRACSCSIRTVVSYPTRGHSQLPSDTGRRLQGHTPGALVAMSIGELYEGDRFVRARAMHRLASPREPLSIASSMSRRPDREPPPLGECFAPSA